MQQYSPLKQLVLVLYYSWSHGSRHNADGSIPRKVPIAGSHTTELDLQFLASSGVSLVSLQG